MMQIAWRSPVTVLTAIALLGCAGKAAPRGPLDLVGDPTQLEPRLLARVRSSPMAYFRFVNVLFASEVCRRYAGDADAMRFVNLHGDAHVEQYAVTDTGRGLTDFDDSATGPAVLDLARFATSLVLACRARHWDDGVDRVVGEFVRGYRSALADPRTTAPIPRIVQRIRAGFRSDPSMFFSWLDTIVEPIPESTDEALRAALRTYVDEVLAADPSLRREYLQIVSLARLHIGLGSARSLKYLARVRGPSDSPDDDDVLEVKQVGDLSGIACLSRSVVGDPTRVIVGQARLAYSPFRLVGRLVLDGTHFWVHAWPRSYQELAVGELESVNDLAEVAFDAGVQLGLGHPKFMPTNPNPVRASAVRLLDSRRAELVDLSKTMADETIAAWKRFLQKSDARRPQARTR